MYKTLSQKENCVYILEKISNIYVLLISSLFLLFTGFQSYTSITLAKTIMFWSLSGLYIVICAAVSIVNIGNYKKVPLSSFQLGIIAYFLLTLIAWLASKYRSQALVGMTRYEGLITIGIYCIVAFLVSRYGKATRNIIKVFSVSLVIFCIISFLQLEGLNPLGLYPGQLTYYDANKAYMGAYIGTIGNIDMVSAVLSPACACLFVSSYKIKSGARWLALVSALCCLYILLKIWVKSGLLALTISLVVLCPFVVDIKTTIRKKLVVVMVVVLLLFALFIYLVPTNITLLNEVREILHGNIDANFGTGRIGIWRLVLSKIKEAWIFGYGPDTMVAFRIDPWGVETVKLGQTIHTYIDAAHNEYLNVWFHQGIFALMSFVAIIFLTIKKHIKLSGLSAKKSILLAYVLTYSIQAFFNISMNVCSIYFWIAIGLLSSDN